MNIRLFLFTFSVIFAKIWHNIANIIQNKLIFFVRHSVFVIVRNRRTLLNCLIEVFLAKGFDKVLKFNFFSSKMTQNMLLLVHLVKFCQN